MTTETADVVIQPSTGSGAWAEVEAGSYDAIVSDLEDTGASQFYPDDGPQLKVSFALESELDEDGNMIVLNRWISQKWSEKSNLFKLAQACGLQPDPTQPFRVSGLKAQQCQVVVEIKNKGKENQRPGITAFLPRQKAKAAARRAAPAAAAPDPNDIGPCVVCDKPGEQYTPNGKVVCAQHAG